MGQYTRTSPPAGVITTSYIDGELEKIEDAFNSLSVSNFPADCIPGQAFAQKSYITVELGADIAASQVITTEQDIIVVPKDATLVDVQVICLAVNDGGGDDPTVDVYQGASSILDAVATIATAETVYTPSIDTSAFDEEDELTLRATTGAGASITSLRVNLVFKTDFV